MCGLFLTVKYSCLFTAVAVLACLSSLILHEDLDCQQVAYVKLAPYCFLKSGKRANFNLKKQPWIFQKRIMKCTSVVKTTVTFQNVQKLTFNPIYFGNEFGDPNVFLHFNISFSLSTKYADAKKICKKFNYRILLQSAYLLLNIKKFRSHRTRLRNKDLMYTFGHFDTSLLS